MPMRYFQPVASPVVNFDNVDYFVDRRADCLAGVTVTNDLENCTVSNVEITSVVSSKATGTLSYAFNWSNVDVACVDKSKGNWTWKQVVAVARDLAISPKGGSCNIGCKIFFDTKYRHYWQVKCIIGNSRYKIDKDNAQCNVWKIDKGSFPRFTFREENREGGKKIRIDMVFDSGRAYFYMIRE